MAQSMETDMYDNYVTRTEFGATGCVLQVVDPNERFFNVPSCNYIGIKDNKDSSANNVSLTDLKMSNPINLFDSIPVRQDDLIKARSGFDEKHLLFTDLSNKYKVNPNEWPMQNKEEFQRRFDKMSRGIFAFIDPNDWKHLVISGGSVYLALSKIPLKDIDKMDYDFDLLVHGLNEREAIRLIDRVHRTFENVMDFPRVVRTSRTITIVAGQRQPPVQIVTKLYENKMDILHQIDLGSCKVVYDYNNVYTNMEGYYSLYHQINIYKPACNSSNYASRCYKYATRGMALGVPNLDPSRISNHIFKKATYVGKGQQNDTETEYESHVQILVGIMKYYRNKKEEKEEKEASYEDGWNDNSYDSEGKNDWDRGGGCSDMLDMNSRYGRRVRRSRPQHRAQTNTNTNINPEQGYGAYDCTNFFVRDGTTAEVMANLHKSTMNVLANLKLRPGALSQEDKNNGFQYHDLQKYPIFKEYENMQLALIDQNIAPKNNEISDFFISGPLFVDSTLRKLYKRLSKTCTNIMNDPLDNATKMYIAKYYVWSKCYDVIYFDKQTASDVDNILSSMFELEKLDRMTKTQLEMRDRDGRTRMEAAVRANRVDIVNFLLQKEYNIMERLENGETPLHLAIRERRYEVVKALLLEIVKRYSDYNRIYDNDMRNYANMAMIYGDHKIVLMVLTYLKTSLVDISFNTVMDELKRATYISSVKLTLMYHPRDTVVMDHILSMYKDSNDFGYLFVDSHLRETELGAADVVQFAIAQNDHENLAAILAFLEKKGMAVGISVSCPSVEVILALLKHRTTLTTGVQKKIQNYLVDHVMNLFRSLSFSKILSIIDRAGDFLGKECHNSIKRKMKFKNIFDVEFIDTYNAIKVFAYVSEGNWEGLDKLMPRLNSQYGLYVYIDGEYSKTTVLSLCRNDTEKLSKLLEYISGDVYNKKRTASKKINSLIFKNFSPMYVSDAIKMMTSHPVHGPVMKEHAKKYYHMTLIQMWTTAIKKVNILDGENRFDNFFEMLAVFNDIYESNGEKFNLELVDKSIVKSYYDTPTREHKTRTIDEGVEFQLPLNKMKDFSDAFFKYEARISESFSEFFKPTSWNITEAAQFVSHSEVFYKAVLDFFPWQHRKQNVFWLDTDYGIFSGINVESIEKEDWRYHILVSYYSDSPTAELPSDYNLLEHYPRAWAVYFLHYREKLLEYVRKLDFSKNGELLCMIYKTLKTHTKSVMVKEFLETTNTDGSTTLHEIVKHDPLNLPKGILDDFHTKLDSKGTKPYEHLLRSMTLSKYSYSDRMKLARTLRALYEKTPQAPTEDE